MAESSCTSSPVVPDQPWADAAWEKARQAASRFNGVNMRNTSAKQKRGFRPHPAPRAQPASRGAWCGRTQCSETRWRPGSVDCPHRVAQSPNPPPRSADPHPFDRYILERSSDGVNYQTIATPPANTEIYTDSDLQQENYFYRIKATNTIGTSPASNRIETNDFFQSEDTYYVKAGGLNTNDGLTEETAFATVTKAVQTASNNYTIIIVGPINQTVQVEISKSLSFVGQADATINGTDARMYNITSGGLTVSFDNITFQNANTSLQGAVINLTQASDLTITDCIFNNNTTSANGGAILAGSTGTLTVTGSLFNGNSSFRGGAIAVLVTSP